MTAALLSVALLGLAPAAPALKDKPNTPDPYGEWESEEPGEDIDGKVIVGYRVRFNKDGTRQVLGLRDALALPRRFVFDPKADPPTLDVLTLDESPRFTTRAIYKIEGDRLIICSAFSGKARPTEFADKPGGAGYLQHFRRVKEADQ